MRDVKGLGHRQGEWRMRGIDERRGEETQHNLKSVPKRRAKNRTLRLEPEYLKRYSSEERTQFGKGMMKTLDLNIIVFKLQYFPGFDPELS